jgi:hypothetical protein
MAMGPAPDLYFGQHQPTFHTFWKAQMTGQPMPWQVLRHAMVHTAHELQYHQPELHKPRYTRLNREARRGGR